MMGEKAETKLKGAMNAGEAALSLYLGIPGTAQFFDTIEPFIFED